MTAYWCDGGRGQQAKTEPEPEIIVVKGGEERGHENSAQFGDMLIERRDGESVEDFHRRAREAAVTAGAARVVFGGLRLMNVNDD
jgi:hypothetical protein